MTPGAQTSEVSGDGTTLDERTIADRRIEFLTTPDTARGRVRPQIFASWQRSRELRVRADRVELVHLGDPDADTPLTRSADRVLQRLGDQLDGSPVSIILTDPTGLVVLQHTADPDLARHLDRVMLAPGFNYGEQYVGTNGIGTALESGSAVRVFGHEHYAENLDDLACVGVPVHHPVSGRVVGAVDLTCWRRDATFWLETVARSTAESIREALLADSSPQEVELLQTYLKTCRRMTGIVFAVSRDVVMLNDHARAVLHPVDQAALVGLAGEQVDHERRTAAVVQLPTGREARVYLQPVKVGSRVAGVVVHVKLGEPPATAAPAPRSRVEMPLPGIVGRAPLWLRASHGVERSFLAGEWLAVAGEPGVGKTALLRAVQLRRQPVPRLAVVDAADAAGDPSWVAHHVRPALAGADSLVVQHVDVLPARTLRVLAAALGDARSGADGPVPWVAVTLARLPESGELSDLLRLFPGTVEVPPLRLRTDDLEPLITFLLGRLGHGGHVECSAESLRLLRRSPWPGNVEELHQLLAWVLQHRRSGTIEPKDLPPGTRTVSRRLLSQLESIERDAIVSSLSDAQGNKMRAARALGVSRATIYRKIHEYGIITDPDELAASAAEK